MSQDQIEKFTAFVAANPAGLAARLNDAHDRETLVANIGRYAKEQGYDITDAQARAWLKQYTDAGTKGEMRDEELDSVAGGITMQGVSLNPTAQQAAQNTAMNNMQNAVNSTARPEGNLQNMLKGILGRMS